ncbi:MAG: YggS family pyridoxal phosphate-dependent enzyme [Chloroflexi bacterium]|nr:YggS family pyridoxal phosphate-dependent enzyme [Chloroflexota bacterium]
MTIAERIAITQEKIAAACARVGRSADEVTLIAVSKTHSAEAVLEALAAGLQHFGENRVEESAIKIPLVTAAADRPVIWHMIGHLQSRKARDAAPLFHWVHSVDSVKLAERLSRSVVESGRTLDILLEINVSGEASKAGLAAAAWRTDAAVCDALAWSIEQIGALPALRVRGLMTMAPIVENAEEARPVFTELAALREQLSRQTGLHLPDLSMGMTDDYPVAVEEGATMVRIGRAIFGERTVSNT